MPSRIKCPHCGAGNRESTDTTHCWQCAKPLWEPAERQTYRLDSMPPLGGTTTLRPDDLPPPVAPPRPARRSSVPEWKLWLAAVAALVALAAFCTTLVIYLEGIWRR